MEANITSKICCEKGTMTFDFWNKYIIKNVPSHIRKNIEKIWKDFDDNDFDDNDKCINYMVIGLPSDLQCCYSELWLLDLELVNEQSKYYATIIQNINTSSPYALERCYMQSDDEDDCVYYDIDEILGFISKHNNKEGIKDLLKNS